MPLVCPVDLDRLRLRREIQQMYGRVADAPDGQFHFHRGAPYAVERLGYDAAELAALPPAVTARFAGIGNPHKIARIGPAATVLDIGCGAGTDLLIAARRAGPEGRAIGVDMTDDLRSCARRGADDAGLDNVDVREGDATVLPVTDTSIDVVISNGVFNLVPEKNDAIAEAARVLRPGGRLQIADIALDSALSDEALHNIDLWTG
jgi:arsenite methyltransferase